ncbi:AAA family ATPase [uncultured Bacteroides sp.]|nr:AAA family ATPase [uncultured Bacteroides sp.]
MMNFAVIRRGDCYYVDKTRFIPNQVARKQIYTYLNGFISKL